MKEEEIERLTNLKKFETNLYNEGNTASGSWSCSNEA